MEDEKNIAGVLILENNRTYGRTANKKRLYYKCKPDNPLLPFFLIPYDMCIGFHKHFKNKFITFKYVSWTDKHPIGMIQQNLGDVDNLEAFYEYQLYCKQLHVPISESIALCKTQLKAHSAEEEEEEEKAFVFSIDPEGCSDKDDAISYVEVGKEYEVTVYIADVCLWLELLGMWDVIGSRVATIYLPDKKRSMLPTQFEDLCSLNAGENKHAVATTFRVYKDSVWKCELMKHFQCSVRVVNYTYESPSLLKNKHIRKLMNITQKLDVSVSDYHDFVAFWMTQTNASAATHLRKHKTGIFRSVAAHTTCHWESHIYGSYLPYSDDADLSHAMGFSEYVHFTSPIRRLVDIMNQLMLMGTLANLSSPARAFLAKMKIDKINMDMKAIKKVQSHSNLLFLISTQPQFLDSPLKAIVVTMEKGQGVVYVEELKWMVPVRTSLAVAPRDKVICKLFFLENEDKMYKKVRATLYEVEN